MADQPENGGTQWTIERFHEWLEQTAKNEGSTEQELLHRMMASFWVLTEFEDLVGKDINPGGTSLGDEFEFTHEDVAGPWNKLSEQSPTDEQDSPHGDTDPERIRGLIEGFATYLDEHAPRPTERGPSTESATQQSRGQPTTSQRTDQGRQSAEDTRDQPDQPAATHPAHIEEGVEDFEETLGGIIDRQETFVACLDDVIDTQESMAATVDDLSRQHEELDDAHQSLEARVESDMEKVEKILKRLTEKYRDADSNVDNIESSLVSFLEEHRTTRQQRERLASLLQTAHAHGIETGDCEDCGSTIRLGLLTSPRCPQCSKQLVDIRPGGWFRSNVIRTSDVERDPHPISSSGVDHQPNSTPKERQHAAATEETADSALQSDDVGDDETPSSFDWADE